MTPLVAVIITVVGFGISTLVALVTVALTLWVLRQVGQLARGIAITANGMNEMLIAIRELEDKLKFPNVRNYYIRDGELSAVLGTFAGHVDGDGKVRIHEPYGLLTDNTGDPVTVIVIKRGIGGPLESLE